MLKPRPLGMDYMMAYLSAYLKKKAQKILKVIFIIFSPRNSLAVQWIGLKFLLPRTLI